MPTTVKQGERKGIKAVEKRLGLPEIKGFGLGDDQWRMRLMRTDMFAGEFYYTHEDTVPELKEAVLAVGRYWIQEPVSPPNDARFWRGSSLDIYAYMRQFLADARTRVLSRRKELFLATVQLFPEVSEDTEEWQECITQAAGEPYFQLTRAELVHLLGHEEKWIRDLGMKLLAEATQ